MNRLLIKKMVLESWLLFAACCVLVSAFCFSRVMLICQFNLTKFEPILAQFKAFEKFLPVPLEQFLTYAGVIGVTFSEPVLLLCILVWCISKGSDVVSGELGRGSLEVLLAQPISRGRFVSIHAAFCIVGLLLLCGCLFCSLSLGIHFASVEQDVQPELDLTFFQLPISIPIGEPGTVEMPLANFVDPSLFVLPTISLFCFGLFFHALATCLSCFDRFRWRTIGLTLGIYIIQFLMFVLSRGVEGAKWIGYTTFFSAYQPDAIVQLTRDDPQLAWSFWIGWEAKTRFWESAPLGPLGLCAVLVGLAAGLYAVGIWRFVRRDLPAPL